MSNEKPKIYIKISPCENYGIDMIMATLYFDEKMKHPIKHGTSLKNYIEEDAVKSALANHLGHFLTKSLSPEESIFEIIENSQEQGGVG